MILKRAAVIVLLLGLSAILFPWLAFGLALIGISFLGNFLFFWPQYLLVPYGFVDRQIGFSQAFLPDSAIIGAIVFWLIFAVAFGYLLRNARIRYVVLTTYPAATIVMLLFYWALHQFGYWPYVEGL